MTTEARTRQRPSVGRRAAGRPWYGGAKGRLVLTTGVLLTLGTLLALLFPASARWSFSAATLVGVWPLAVKAARGAARGSPFTINTLITLAALGAVAIGEAAEGAIVVFLFAIGELLESVAAGRARSSIRELARLAPSNALLIEEGGTIREVGAASLEAGQLVQVRPGARIPADGRVVEGDSAIDESAVTGESIARSKGAGEQVFAGSISTDGTLIVRVEQPPSQSAIARIIQLVEEAESHKAPVRRFIDSFSRVYTPVAMLLAALVATMPPLLAGASLEAWVYRGLAILLIACPCALVLSVPAAITSAISAGARAGLLLKGGAALEAIGTVVTVAFDKTGTITSNALQVTDVIPLRGDAEEVVALAAAVESFSSHPLAAAISRRAAGLELPLASAGRAIAGQAASAIVNGQNYSVGSPRYASHTSPMGTQVELAIERLEEEGKTVVVLLEEHTPRGILAVRDEPRPEASEVISRLRKMGVATVMLTGDNSRTAASVADRLRLEVRAELLPEEKLRAIEVLARRGPVAMVGDGINDAPALARANVGIAIGAGTDVALESADAALLREGIGGVPDLFRLSRATMRNIRQNIGFALGLKALFLVTTLLGITGLWPAILADTGATVLVTSNALRLLRFDFGDRT
ncbi:MAG TPA: heavy metal translocating P-type ATPase [Trueperaceae bacterium]